MNGDYTEIAWKRLVEAVEAQYGTDLPDACQGRTLTYSVPDSDNKTYARTCECGQESRLVVQYEPTDGKDKAEFKKLRKRGAGMATVCAVCDFVGDWPNFVHTQVEESE